MTDWLLHESRPNIKSVVSPAKIRFRDLDCDYTMSRKNTSLYVENDNAIINHLKNLLSTPTGTEEFEPSYGSNLPYRIMDPVTPYMAFLIETDTILAIIRWMSDRIRIVMSDSFVTPLDSGDGYLIQLVYINLLNNSTGLFKQEILR